MHSINDSLEQCRFHKGKTTLKSFLSFQAMVSKKWRIENTEAFENLCLKFCYSVASFNEFKFENNKNKSKIAGDKSNQLANLHFQQLDILIWTEFDLVEANFAKNLQFIFLQTQIALRCM